MPESTEKKLTIVSVDEAAGVAPGHTFVVNFKFSTLTLVMAEGEGCNNGMSDDLYSHTAVFKNGRKVLLGCCNVK